MNTKHLREWFGLSQSELSMLFGISFRTVQGWDFRNTLAPWLYDMMYDILARSISDYQFHCLDEGTQPDHAGFLEYFKEHYYMIHLHLSPESK